MRGIRRCTAIIAMLVVGTPALAEITAVVNVNVIPMSSEVVIAARTVVVADGIIVAIGDVDQVPVPEEAEIVDGTDRFLMPGLAEMHAHVANTGSVNLDRDFTLFVANGVTTVRGMLGRSSHLALRSQLLTGAIFGPPRRTRIRG